MNAVQYMVSARRERLKHELREEILDAARGLFVKEGYGSVSMRKIADVVGCAPGTLYLHFEDKGAILNAICIETFAKLDKRMEAIANDPGDPLERLRRGGRAYIQFGLDHPHHYQLTFGPHSSEWSKDENALQAGLHSFQCMCKCIGACVAAGKLRSNDVEEMAQAVWSCAHGIIMLLISKPHFPFIEQNRLIDRVLDITIEGIRKR
jgi:AcrR family transcriptional regulator